MATLHFWHGRNHTSEFTLFMALGAVLSGCSPPESLPGEASSIAGDPIAVVREVRSRPFTLNDELGIGTIVDMVPMATGFAVSDASGSVLLLNEDLSLKARFGGEGSGPSELRLPQDLEVRGNAVAVYDSGNNRIVAIDDVGALAINFPPDANPAGNFAWLPDGSIVVRRGGGQSGLAYYHPSAKGGFGPQPPSAPDDPPDLSHGHLVADPSGRVHHYRPALDLLETYRPDGTLASTLRLPDEVREQIAVARKDAQEAFKGRFIGLSFILGLTTWGEHPVLVAPGLPGIEALALVVETHRGVITPVVSGPSLTGTTIPSPEALTLTGNLLTIGNRSGLYQYEVRFPAHLETR